MKNKKWQILGAPFDLGSRHKGSGDAPAAIREAGLTRILPHLRTQGIEVEDRGDIRMPPHVTSDCIPTGLEEMITYAPLLMKSLDNILNNNNIPLVIGGDHSISIPTATTAADFLRKRKVLNTDLGVIWIDAHPDLETPGKDSTNDLHAMPAAHLLGFGLSELRTLRGFSPKVKPENLIFIGLRDVVPEELQIIRDKSITSYTMSDIERLGIVNVCEEAFEHMKKNTHAFLLSFDIDAVDPMTAPGVDYPAPGGLTFREAMVIMEFAAQSENLILFELLEANPKKDIQGLTSRLAVNLIRRILSGPII
jgi:arginase